MFGAEQGITSITVIGRNSGVGRVFVRAYAKTAGEYKLRIWVKNAQCKTGPYSVGVTLK